MGLISDRSSCRVTKRPPALAPALAPGRAAGSRGVRAEHHAGRAAGGFGQRSPRGAGRRRWDGQRRMPADLFCPPGKARLEGPPESRSGGREA